jgi:hypothetical protein
MRWYKKGQEDMALEDLVYLIVFGVLMGMLLFFALRIWSEKEFEMKKIATDRALTLDKLIGSSFDAEVVMPENPLNVTEEYVDGVVKIALAKNAKYAQSVAYVRDDAVQIEPTTLSSDSRRFFTKFIKQENVLLIGGDNMSLDPRFVQCTKPKFERIPSLVVNPEKGGRPGEVYEGLLPDLGAVNPSDASFYESEVTLSVAQQLSGDSVFLTRTEQKRTPLAARLEVVAAHNGSAVLSIGVGNDSNAENVHNMIRVAT